MRDHRNRRSSTMTRLSAFLLRHDYRRCEQLPITLREGNLRVTSSQPSGRRSVGTQCLCRTRKPLQQLVMLSNLTATITLLHSPRHRNQFFFKGLFSRAHGTPNITRPPHIRNGLVLSIKWPLLASRKTEFNPEAWARELRSLCSPAAPSFGCRLLRGQD